MLDIHHILTKLPHRYPFLLVDRVLDLDIEAKTIRAVKNVTYNEPCFTGHFPNRPVFPGVLMLEAMAQTCALLSFEVTGMSLGDDSVFYFVGIDGARFKRPVEPGDAGLRRSGAVLAAAAGAHVGGDWRGRRHGPVDFGGL